MSLKKQALSGMVWSAIQTFGNQITGFIVSIILARLLLPAEFGLIGMIAIFMGVSSVLISSGLGASLIRTDKPTQTDYSTVFVFNMVGSMLLYVIMFFAAPFIANFFKQPVLTSITRWYCLIFVINAFSAIQITRLHKNLDFKTETKASLISTAVSAIVGITLAYSEFGVMSLVWMAIAGAIVNNVMLWGQSGWRPSLLFDREKFSYHFGFGSRMMFSGILDIVFTNAYTLIIGKLYSPAALGYYNRADTLKQLPISNFSSILNKVTYPLFAEIKDDNIRLKSVYKQIMKMVIFVIAPVLMLMGVLAEPLFRLLFTEKWLPAVPYFQILCLSGLLYPLHSYNLNILSVKGRSDLFLRLEVIKKIVLVFVIAVSLPFGIYGLMWGRVVSSILAFFINTYYSGRFLNYTSWEQLRDIAPALLLTICMGSVVWVVDWEFSTLPDFLRLLIAVTVGILFFLTFARIFKFDSGKTVAELVHKKVKFSIPIKFNPFS